MHRNLLRLRFKYFESIALNSSASHLAVVELKDVSPAIFVIYADILYTGKLMTKGGLEWAWLCQTYILAERLQDVESKNLVIDGMSSYLRESLLLFSALPVAKHRADVNANNVAWLYKHTPAGCSACRLLVDFYADNGRVEWLQAEKGKYASDFLFDVTVALMQKRSVVLSIHRRMVCCHRAIMRQSSRRTSLL